MNAALALHVALSMRLDAREAYRLAHAYRDEELQKYADRLASRATLYGDSATVAEVIKDLRDIATRKASDEAAPDFFRPGHTYTRAPWRFRCEAVTTHPLTMEKRAIGWRRIDVDGDLSWDTTALDPDDWTHGHWVDVTEGGEGQ